MRISSLAADYSHILYFFYFISSSSSFFFTSFPSRWQSSSSAVLFIHSSRVMGILLPSFKEAMCFTERHSRQEKTRWFWDGGGEGGQHWCGFHFICVCVCVCYRDVCFVLLVWGVCVHTNSIHHFHNLECCSSLLCFQCVTRHFVIFLSIYNSNTD